MLDQFTPHDDSFALARLGLDPSRPMYDLNLAGVEGVPSPQVLQAVPPPITGAFADSNKPEFGVPDFSQPSLQPYDLTAPGITHMPAFSADPALPDITAYNQPYDIDLLNTGLLPAAEYSQAVPTQAEVEASLYPGLGFDTLNITTSPQAINPLVSDLQHPALEQQVQRPANERPGDLDPSALDVLHGTGSYQQTADKHYPASWMDQHGMNDTRARHMSLLTDGLL